MKQNRWKLVRYSLLALSLAVVWLTQTLPVWGETYARTIYPYISGILTPLSGLFFFSVGDLFIFCSIAGVILYPVIARRRRKHTWKRIVINLAGYLAGVYVWFYLAWGLNYSQYNFYQRTQIPYVAYTPENFQSFVNDYVTQLNAAYSPITPLNKEELHQEVLQQYRNISDCMGVHPPQGSPRAKTMLFTPLFSKMAITGYMGPFFCEFNLNGELLPHQYASTYAHELAHLLGITSEAEANFYAYQVCTRSDKQAIRFSGYLSILGHVLRNSMRLYTEEAYKELLQNIRPEILELFKETQNYWRDKYSPTISDIQSWMYDWYLKGNKIESGRKNYSEVIGLLISWHSYPE